MSRLYEQCFGELRRLTWRQIFYQVLCLFMVFCSALMIWKGLIFATNCESPIVVVLSGSMEPAMHRGDVLLLTNSESDPVRVGDVTVFKVDGREIPIVHRVIKVHEEVNNHTRILTKGDHNQVDDRALYAPGQLWLGRGDVVGRAKGIVPYIGMVTIMMNDYPTCKILVLVALAAFAMLRREK